ncbi:mechanosensitive ion channel family protein [Agrobacterium genomosp. 3]|uniref:Small-conductance mechanosensitive channel n=3 Tax=Agrobacterium TaxID=357 RepID=A0AAE6BKS8_AGRTU|nr:MULTISPECIES: mechanosensitive ion channel family protein [Rhizobium/Agrobacterium group]MCA1866620.1 mechanosensitive ion channel family protein [Agrobacterium tomkonis]MCA2379696.1 mechanosensitive ion channel family protein [Agrobacterium tomkonis RTP8]MCA1876971.1 mechanosensitive ion channel family protein [Agrobacterium tumefaciens]MCA1892530.1 mechanosensitive ion channel family protein [Agrobacterium tomkonis]MCA2373857.1 mechanosensitive ion channel family protein [Agrobacterium to
MEQQATDIIVASQAAVRQASALAVQYSFSIVGALLLLIVGWLAATFLQRWAFQGLSRIRGFDETLAGFFAGAIRYVVLILVLVMVLGQFGVQTASILAALGAAGLAIGLALQGTLQNIAAGIMLLVLRPFRVGEYIETNTVSGTVVEIGLFATELKTSDGLYRLAPNSTLWNVPITNYSRFPSRRHELSLTVKNDDDLAAAQDMLMRVVRSESRVLLDPSPITFVDSVSADSATVKLRYWVRSDSYFATTRDVTKAMKLAFDERKAEVSAQPA